MAQYAYESGRGAPFEIDNMNSTSMPMFLGSTKSKEFDSRIGPLREGSINISTDNQFWVANHMGPANSHHKALSICVDLYGYR